MRQAGMQAAEQRLQEGDWVHIFPEGTRTRDGSGRMGPVRKGVGRLVAACAVTPLVVPFVHAGMEEIMPRGKLVPAVGKQVQLARDTGALYSWLLYEEVMIIQCHIHP